MNATLTMLSCILIMKVPSHPSAEEVDLHLYGMGDPGLGRRTSSQSQKDCSLSAFRFSAGFHFKMMADVIRSIAECISLMKPKIDLKVIQPKLESNDTQTVDLVEIIKCTLPGAYRDCR